MLPKKKGAMSKRIISASLPEEGVHAQQPSSKTLKVSRRRLFSKPSAPSSLLVYHVLAQPPPTNHANRTLNHTDRPVMCVRATGWTAV